MQSKERQAEEQRQRLDISQETPSPATATVKAEEQKLEPHAEKSLEDGSNLKGIEESENTKLNGKHTPNASEEEGGASSETESSFQAEEDDSTTEDNATTEDEQEAGEDDDVGMSTSRDEGGISSSRQPSARNLSLVVASPEGGQGEGGYSSSAEAKYEQEQNGEHGLREKAKGIRRKLSLWKKSLKRRNK